MANGFLENLFSGQPTNVFDSYASTANSLNTLRKQKIANALNQIKLNYAPQMAKQAADQGAADVTIEQNKANYAPRMSAATLAGLNLTNQGKAIDNRYAPVIKQLEINSKQIANAMDSQKFKDLPAQDKADLAFKQAQTSLALAHAHAFLGKATAPVKGAPTYFDLKGNPIPAPIQQPMDQPSQTMAPPSSSAPIPIPDAPPAPQATPNVPQDASAAPAASAAAPSAPQPPEQTFPGADPKAPNILQSVGPTDSRGHAAALYNPHTGERFSVLSPTQRTQMQNQLISLRQAIPYIDDLKKYGTVGAIGATGKNELIPNALGGVPRGVGAEYDKALAAATEHVMTGSKLQKTDATVNMVNTILARQNFESRADYTNRMNKFQQHLRDLDENTKGNLALNAMSLDKYTSDAEQKYVTDQYNNITSDTVDVIRPDGTEGTIPKENLQKALSRGYKRAS